MSQADVIDKMRVLLNLLDDNHPGLASWNIACENAYVAVKDSVIAHEYERLNSQSTKQHLQNLRRALHVVQAKKEYNDIREAIDYFSLLQLENER